VRQGKGNAAAGCPNRSIHGEFNLAGSDEVPALMKGDGSGPIQR
jgi:hypothetical protein